MGKKESNPMPPDISEKPSPPLESGYLKQDDGLGCYAFEGVKMPIEIINFAKLEVEIQDILYSISDKKGSRALNTDLCSAVAEEIIKTIKAIPQPATSAAGLVTCTNCGYVQDRVLYCRHCGHASPLS